MGAEAVEVVPGAMEAAGHLGTAEFTVANKICSLEDDGINPLPW